MKEHKLKQRQELQAWSFRVDNRLHMALVKVNKKARSDDQLQGIMTPSSSGTAASSSGTGNNIGNSGSGSGSGTSGVGNCK